MKRAPSTNGQIGSTPRRIRAGYLATSLVVNLFSLFALAACQAPAERQAAPSAELKRRASVDIDRVCALPEKQREEELRRIKEQTGLGLYCGSN